MRLAGVNVIGPLRDESGVGEAARSVVRALDAVGVPVLPVIAPQTSVSRQGVRLPAVSLDRAVFPVNLLCLTPVETMAFLEHAGSAWRNGRHTVGLWWWEISELPVPLYGAFRCVDEVWAGSAHVAEAFRRPAAAAGVPVKRVPFPVRVPPPTTVRREQLGLPEGFKFLTVFGYYSSVRRKNPAGAIEAFSRAFVPGEGPSLIVKCIDEQAHPAEHAEVLAAAARHPDVYVLPGYRSRAHMDGLVQVSDAVVSLHRAEGFGFSLAEAMGQGKPVVATGYSGNLDFMTAENAQLVPWRAVPVGLGGGPYPPEAVWAEPDIDAAAFAMREVYANAGLRERIGERAARDIKAGFSAEAAGDVMQAALAKHKDQHRWARARARARVLRRLRRRPEG